MMGREERREGERAMYNPPHSMYIIYLAKIDRLQLSNHASELDPKHKKRAGVKLKIKDSGLYWCAWQGAIE